MTAPRSPIQRAKLEAIQAHLKDRARNGYIYNRSDNTVALTTGTYRDLRRLGFTKSEVDRAANELVDTGQARFRVTAHSGVLLKIYGGHP